MGARYVCRSCQRTIQGFKIATNHTPPKPSRLNTAFRLSIHTRRASTVAPHRPTKVVVSELQQPRPTPVGTGKSARSARNPPNPFALLRSVVNGQKAIAASNAIPDEVDVLELLEKCRALSELLVFGETDSLEEEDDPNTENEETSTSSLLDDLEEKSQDAEQLEISHENQMTHAFRQSASASVTRIVNSLVLDPKVYITPEMLQGYVRIQALLGQPEHMPDVFHLYANKPIPKPQTHDPIEYTLPNPRAVQNAIPTQLADAALDCALLKRNLPLALSIIDTTFRAPAFSRAKLLKQAGPPLAAITCLPIIALTAGNYVSDWQNTLDPSTAAWMTVAGCATYFGVTGTIGYVALTTSNDQMERVTWAPGLGLWKRWMREDERSAFDRIAMAWGFKERRRRGEETGEEWEALREFCGMRDMVLDKTNLMDDME